MNDASPRPIRQLAMLSDPARHRLYQAVADSDKPISRDAAAKATGMSRTLAAYHLDQLVDAGLLQTSFARPNGVGGPGAGRPAKHYSRTRDEHSVSLPPRDYELLAQLLAAAYEHDESGTVHAALMEAARSEGRRAGTDRVDAGRSLDDLFALLRERGYEPTVDERGDIQLRNCPFHRLAQRHTPLVCGLNHALLSGVLQGAGDDGDRAELCPAEGHCCVVIRSRAHEGT